MKFEIRPGTEDDIPHLPAIERAAAEKFSMEDLPEPLRSEITSLEKFDAAREAGLLWVSETEFASVAAFVYAEQIGDDLYLAEIDCHPKHAGRGIGRELVGAVQQAARDRGCAAVTLTTYKHLQWNGHFYVKCYFDYMDPVDIPAYLAEKLEMEARAGLIAEKRVAMRWDCRATAATEQSHR